jgi:hypothetical protein
MGHRGPGWAGARAGAGAGGSSPWARPKPLGYLFFFLLFFSEFISSAKTNPENIQKLFKGTKNTPKITKIPGKFLEID